MCTESGRYASGSLEVSIVPVAIAVLEVAR